MADILRGYGLAREQAHFKIEQEADVQRHRQRLMKEGKLSKEKAAGDEEAPAAAAAQKDQPFDNSEHAYEILAEVLQQQARVDDPHALRRRQYERRVKGGPLPPSEADLLRARSKMFALGAAVGHVPRMSMGRNRWDLPQAGAGGGEHVLAGVRQLTPEAREVASRTYVAGVRAVIYGSLLGVVGLAAAGTYAVHSLGITSGEELGERMRGGLAPISVAMRSWLLPLKERAEGWLAPAAPVVNVHGSVDLEGQQVGAAAGAVIEGSGGTVLAADGGGRGVSSEFSRRLQQRYNPREGAEEGGSATHGGADA